MAVERGRALGVGVVAIGVGGLAATYAAWRTYDRPETLFCRATSGVPNYFPCLHQPRAHVRILPTVGVGLAAVALVLIVLLAFRCKLRIAPGAAVGEFAAYKTYVYPTVSYACAVGQACRPDPQPHVNLAVTIFWGTFATGVAGAIALAFLRRTRKAGNQAPSSEAMAGL
jgi:hypothetical protein